MKKIKGLFIWSIVLVFTILAGCSGGQEAVPTNTTPTNGSTPSSAANGLEAIKARGKLIAGVKFDTNLFGLLDPADNQVKGFDVDLMKELAKKLYGNPDAVEFKQVTSKTRIPMLDNGDIDIISATMTITEERKKQVDFSDVYFKAGQSLLVPKGSPITGLADLKGKTVLVVKGSTSEQNITKMAPEAVVKQFENYQEAFAALRSNKGDALSTDNAILMGMKKQDPNFDLVGGLFTDEPYGLAVKKGNTEFVAYVNEFLKEIHANGKYAEIYKKWFGEEPPAQ